MKHQPMPMIIVDTREQKPYQFENCPTMIRKLDTGDYSLHGFENQFAIERKELNDFISCMIEKEGCENRSRFERELSRAKEKLRRLWILVEADFKDVRHGAFRSEIKVASVVATIIAWQNRYPIQVVWGGDRSSSAKLAKLILERSFRDWTEGKVSS
jgi:ERCC4-type nuclease